MKKVVKGNKNLKTYSREETSKVKGGNRRYELGRDRATDVGARPCPPPEPDRE